MNPSISIFSLTIFLVLVQSCFAIQLKISDGILQGTQLKSRSGKDYFAFLGIPYAKTPKRFKLAEAPDPWSGIRDATKYGDRCTQKIPFAPQLGVLGNENCLFINVFTHNMKEKLPVMIFIHGGAFMFGSSSEFGADYLMDENIILVTLNYRVGALGFLSTGDGEIEPNLGLKDQNLALKWVQNNIHEFGGDRNKVLLFGESAGSASTHYHVLSPLSKGLFQQAIMQSGSALNHWAFVKNPSIAAFELGEHLGCNTESSKSLLECLESKSAQEIVKQDLTKWHVDPVVQFAPSLDVHGKSEQIFVPDAPINLLKAGTFNKVPAIFTICEDEGLLFHSVAISRNEKLQKDINDDFRRVLPITLQFDIEKYSIGQMNWISDSIKKFYFGTKKISSAETFKNLTNLFSDRHFIHGMEKSLLYHAKQGVPVYNAILTYKGTHSHTSLLGTKEVLGVSHADDLLYLFKLENFPATAPNSQDEMASKLFVSLWAKFATTGNPGFEWMDSTWDTIDASKSDEPTWFQFSYPPKLLENPFKDRVNFWDKVWEKANNERTKEEL